MMLDRACSLFPAEHPESDEPVLEDANGSFSAWMITRPIRPNIGAGLWSDTLENGIRVERSLS